MKSIFSSRRHKLPHNNEANTHEKGSFFSKESKQPFFNKANAGTVQTKLKVGQPNDKYEKEADSVADAVVNKPSTTPNVQNKQISSIQRESLATPQEDEKLGTAEQRIESDKLVQEKPEIQRMEAPEEEMLSKTEEEEPIQKMEGAEEEEVQAKAEEESELQKMEAPEEEVQAKEDEEVQTKKATGTKNTTSKLVSNKISEKSGKGRKMSKNTKVEMEKAFGKDFSKVSIHTDQEAIGLNKKLGAQAFTNGSDIYFNSGKYDPDSSKGKHLLAHELTHVVQQGKAK